MPTRKRIQVRRQGGDGNGAGRVSAPEQVTGTLEWGPNFGKVADDTFVGQGAISIFELALDGTLVTDATFDLTAIDLDGNVVAQNVIDLASIDLLGALASQAAITLDDVALDGNLAAQGTFDLFAVDPTGEQAVQAQYDLVSLDLDGDLSSAGEWRTTVEVDQWDASGDVYLEEDNPDTNRGGTIVLEARAQSPLANDRIHAYIKWDVGGTFTLDDSQSSGSMDEIQFVFYANHNAIVTNNPATLFVEVYRGNSDPFDEDTATWNNTEPPPGTQTPQGTQYEFEIDNTATPDVTDAFGNDWYRVEFDYLGGFNDFDNSLEGDGERWWWLRMLGDTNLGQDNVLFEIRSRDVEEEIGGNKLVPNLNFIYEDFA